MKKININQRETSSIEPQSATDEDDHVSLDLYSLFIGFMLGAALLAVAVCVGAAI